MKRTFELSVRGSSLLPDGAAIDLGYVCFIIFNCREYSSYQIITLKLWISRAIEHDQILFFFDKAGNPFGYITWAHLAPDTEERLLNDPNFLIHPSEWSEGGNTWIVDFCFPFGGLFEASKLAKEFFRKKNIEQVFWARRNNRFIVRKIGRLNL